MFLHRHRHALRVAAAVAALTALGATAAAAGAHGGKHHGHRWVTQVTERDVGKTWSAGDTRPGGGYAFVRDHGAPQGFGKGALLLSTDSATAKVQMLTDRRYAGKPLAAVAGRIRYSTFRTAESTADPIQVAALNIAIDPDGPGGPDTFATLVYEPYYSSLANGRTGPNVASGVWQTWDAGAGYWWATGTQVEGNEVFAGKTLAELSALNPQATILYYGFNQGSGNPGLTSLVDGLAFGKLTYDLEPRKARRHHGHHRGHHRGQDCGPQAKSRSDRR